MLENNGDGRIWTIYKDYKHSVLERDVGQTIPVEDNGPQDLSKKEKRGKKLKKTAWSILGLTGIMLGASSPEKVAASGGRGEDLSLHNSLDTLAGNSWDGLEGSHHISLGSSVANSSRFFSHLEHQNFEDPELNTQALSANWQADTSLNLPDGSSYNLNEDQHSSLMEQGWVGISSGDVLNGLSEPIVILANEDNGNLDVLAIPLGEGNDDTLTQLDTVHDFIANTEISRFFANRGNESMLANFDKVIDPLLITISQANLADKESHEVIENQFGFATDDSGVSERIWDELQKDGESRVVARLPIATNNDQVAMHDVVVMSSIPGSLEDGHDGDKAILLVPVGGGSSTEDVLRVLANDNVFAKEQVENLQLTTIDFDSLEAASNERAGFIQKWTVVEDGNWEVVAKMFGDGFEEEPLVLEEGSKAVITIKNSTRELLWLKDDDGSGGVLLNASFARYQVRNLGGSIANEVWDDTPAEVKLNMVIRSMEPSQIGVAMYQEQGESDEETLERIESFSMIGLNIVGMHNIEKEGEAGFREAIRMAGSDQSGEIMIQETDGFDSNKSRPDQILAITINPDGSVNLVVGVDDQLEPVECRLDATKVIVLHANNIKDAAVLSQMFDDAIKSSFFEGKDWLEVVNSTLLKEGSLTTSDMWGSVDVSDDDWRHRDVEAVLLRKVAEKLGARVLSGGMLEVVVPHPTLPGQEVTTQAVVKINQRTGDFFLIPDTSPNFDRLSDKDMVDGWFDQVGDSRADQLFVPSSRQKAVQFLINEPEDVARAIKGISELTDMGVEEITEIINSKDIDHVKDFFIDEHSQGWFIQRGDSYRHNGNLERHRDYGEGSESLEVISLTKVDKKITPLVEAFFDPDHPLNELDGENYVHLFARGALRTALLEGNNGINDKFAGIKDQPSWILDTSTFRSDQIFNGHYRISWGMDNQEHWGDFLQRFEDSEDVEFMTMDGKLNTAKVSEVKQILLDEREVAFVIGGEYPEMVKLTVGETNDSVFMTEVGANIDSSIMDDMKDAQLYFDTFDLKSDALVRDHLSDDTVKLDGDRILVRSHTGFNNLTVVRQATVVTENGTQMALIDGMIDALKEKFPNLSLSQMLENEASQKEALSEASRSSTFDSSFEIPAERLVIDSSVTDSRSIFFPNSLAIGPNGEIHTNGILVSEDTGFDQSAQEKINTAEAGSFIFNGDKSLLIIFDKYGKPWMISRENTHFNESMSKDDVQAMIDNISNGRELPNDVGVEFIVISNKGE